MRTPTEGSLFEGLLKLSPIIIILNVFLVLILPATSFGLFYEKIKDEEGGGG